jgi:hypothetical protein
MQRRKRSIDVLRRKGLVLQALTTFHTTSETRAFRAAGNGRS